MKQYKRWLAAFVAFLLCISLSGCAKLDELRARHAVWQEDGTILWNDAVYKVLPDVLEAEANISTRLQDTPIHVTESDVPLLLSSQFYDYFESDPEGVFLRGYMTEFEGKYFGNYKLFCREDRYEEVAAELVDGFVPAGLCYDYFDYHMQTMQTYYVTKEQEYDISYILDTAEWFFYEEGIHSVYEVELYSHDAINLYRSYEMLLMYTGGGFYIVKDNIAYCVKTDYEQTMRDILLVGYNAESAREIEWYE